MRSSLSFVLFFAFALLSVCNLAHASPDPAAVGWGNLFAPGLGATLRGESTRGLMEATGTLGTYFGGTYLAEQAHFSMDGSVKIPEGGSITRPLLGQFLQEAGLKSHMYFTFYNYQQASLDPSQAETQGKYQQPLYKGAWDDILLAPFKPKNLSSAWVYLPLIFSTGYLYYSYKTDDGSHRGGQSSGFQDAVFGVTQGVGVPLGSSFGEEALWRGFMQREFYFYTGSLTAAIALQSISFVAVHTPRLRPAATAGGIYFGVLANHFDGDLEPGIAAHFWVDFISGVFNYFSFRKSEGRGAPLHVGVQIPI